MRSRGWWRAALATGAVLALVGSASAGDDTFDLKLRKSSAASASELTREQRATVSDVDDTEEVNLRYRLGYNRASYGSTYYWPRTYAWRAGYYSGSNGSAFLPYVSFRSAYSRPLPVMRGGYGYASGYSGASYGYGSGGSYSSASYGVDPGYSGAPANYGTVGIDPNTMPAPSAAPQAPARMPMPSVGPDNTLPMPQSAPSAAPRAPSRMPMPRAQPNSRPMAEPLPSGAPRAPARMPMPSAQPEVRPMEEPVPSAPDRLPPLPSEPQPKRLGAPPSDGQSRLVKMESPQKKHAYPAYGEHLRSSSDGDTRLVKLKK